MQSSRPLSLEGIAKEEFACNGENHRRCTDELFLLWLEPSIEFRFTPGQYITMSTKGFERPYSIASAPYETDIELFGIRLRYAELTLRVTASARQRFRRSSTEALP